jgi:hemerythrin superfamily protein
MTSAAQKGQKAKSTKPQDAISLLRADHQLVEELFVQYEKSRSTAKKRAIIKEICAELTIHARIEEEIFYPQVKEALKDHDLVPEAIVEHTTLKDLIAQLQEDDIESDVEMFDAKVKVLCEYVQHHVKEEQNEMFPKVRDSKLDLKELAVQLQERKEELHARLD